MTVQPAKPVTKKMTTADKPSPKARQLLINTNILRPPDDGANDDEDWGPWEAKHKVWQAPIAVGPAEVRRAASPVPTSACSLKPCPTWSGSAGPTAHWST